MQRETNMAIQGYTFFKRYVRFVNNNLMLRRRYVIGRENIPSEGERFLIVSNHENTAMDPLNIIFELPDDERVGSVARGNMFGLHPLASRFLTWLGIVPAYRLDYDGIETLEKNTISFQSISDKVNSGTPVIVFPSAGHSQGHYILPFTTGFVKMAFYCLEQDNWQHDVKILPTAVVYSSYMALRGEFMLVVGKPISLLPYKEEYEQHPFRVLRQIRDYTHTSIQTMMLDESGDNYDEVDFLRRSPYFNPAATKPLPIRLEGDKAFVKRLRDNSQFQDIISLTKQLIADEKAHKVTEVTLDRKASEGLVRTLLLLLFLPIGIISLFPHGLCYWLPTLLLKEDKMFTASYRFIISVLFLYPLFAIITLLVLGLAFNSWLTAIVWILLWIPTGIAGIRYFRYLSIASGIFHRIILRKKIKNGIMALREKIKEKISA